jgi:hypothetical protein
MICCTDAFIAGHHGGYHPVHHIIVVHRTHGHSYRGHHKVTLHVHLHVHHGYGGRKYTKYHGFKITHHGFIYRRVGKASLPQNDNNTHESTYQITMRTRHYRFPYLVIEMLLPCLFST